MKLYHPLKATLIFGAALLPALPSCTQLYETNLLAAVDSNNKLHRGLDMFDPVLGLFLCDGESYYMLVPVVEYNNHTPLVMTLKESMNFVPEKRNIRPAAGGAHLLVRITPGTNGLPNQVGLLMLKEEDNIEGNAYAIEPGSRPGTCVISCSAINGKRWATKNLTPLKGGAEQLRKGGIPRYINSGNAPDDSLLYNIAIAPIAATAVLADLGLTMASYAAEAVIQIPVTLVKTCLGCQNQDSNEPRDNHRAESPRVTIVALTLEECMSPRPAPKKGR